LLQELLREKPGDTNISATYLTSFQSLGLAYARTGKATEGTRALEEGVAFAEEALKKDPGNETLLKSAAGISVSLSTMVEPVSARRARDIELTARNYLATLVHLDPSNRSGRLSYAKCFWREASYLRRDGQLAAARQVLVQVEALMRATGDLRQLRASEAPGGPQGGIYEAGRQQAECAATMGDRTDAEAWLAISAKRCAVIRDWAGDNRAGADFVAALLWNTRVTVAISLRDWPAAGQVAREAISAIDAMPVASTWDDVVQIRAMAVRALGQAKLRQGDAVEAVPLLQKAQEVLQDADETLGEALGATGDAAQAQKLLRSALAVREADYQREPDLWETRRNLAHASYLLARVLEPTNADTVRERTALLGRAMTLLDGSEAEARLTAGDREMKAEITALGSG
jgi:tetratricopeptide (TPR) repeat protein